MRAASVTVYPIKSTQGVPREAAEVEPWGLSGDRRGIVIDRRGEKLTARTHAKLLTVRATLRDEPAAGNGTQTLRLAGPHTAPLELALPNGEAATAPVNVWGAEVAAAAAGAAPDAWLSELLGEPVRLLWLADPTQRPVNPAYGRPTDRVSLADGYPLLLTNLASLRQLDDWIAEEALERGELEPPAPLDMRRFRPNVTVTGAPPFAEDGWRRLRIGEVSFRAAKLCSRCVLTTIDPDTLVSGKEPLRTLARRRRWDGKVWFGMNLIPDTPGVLRPGDEVEILERAR